jgi:hypothetical protein
MKPMLTWVLQHPEIYGSELDDDEEEPETLEVLDPLDPEETRSRATSSKATTTTHVDATEAKPDTEPADADKPEDKVAETGKGVDAEQTVIKKE